MRGGSEEVITELDKEGLKDLISILSGRDKGEEEADGGKPHAGLCPGTARFLWRRRIHGRGRCELGSSTGKVDINCYAAGTGSIPGRPLPRKARRRMRNADGGQDHGLYGSRAAGEAGASGRIKEDWLESWTARRIRIPLPKDVKPEI